MMSPQKIKENILKYQWRIWLERPFGAFILSLFEECTSRKCMRRVGVDARYKATVFENGTWYRSDEVTVPFAKELKKYLAPGKSIFEISHSCEKFYREKKKQLLKIISEDKSCKEKLAGFYKIISVLMGYIWLAHGFDDVYTEKLKEEVPKYFQGDIDKFIGDICFPKKKNAYALMEEAILKGKNLKKIQNDFGWIRVRDGFSPGFSINDLKLLKKKIIKSRNDLKRFKIKIPKPLKSLAAQAQEAVYFRTFRTDVFHEFIFLIRPVLKEAAKYYQIEFENLKNYSILNLINGQPHEYLPNVTMAAYNGHLVFFDKPILPKTKLSSSQIKGAVAYPGKVQGVVKVIKKVSELNKLKEREILVAPMTFPSFIVAMKKAAAFVTNEGGITCHAAIVAREIKKPCIIGTKIATKVLKDGDLVEVDATKGVVKILKTKS